MVKTAILLDGDFSRRLVRRKLNHKLTPAELETFCRAHILAEEQLYRTYYYDCPPFSRQRPAPISGNMIDFTQTRVFQEATIFQHEMQRNRFFEFRRGYLSFNGWVLKDSVIKSLISGPRALTDGDFDPDLIQKQVDMKIGFDVAKLSITHAVERILLATSDEDFVPAIHFAKTFRIEVVLLSDVVPVRKTKGRLLKAFSDHRIV